MFNHLKEYNTAHSPSNNLKIHLKALIERRYNLAFAVSGERLCSTIVYLKMRNALSGTGITMTRLFGRASSLMCTRKADGKICKSQ